MLNRLFQWAERDRRTVLRFLGGIAALHAVFLLVYSPLNPRAAHTFDHWAVIAAELAAATFYFVWVVLTIGWAPRTRLNLAMGFQKFYWFLLIVGVALPFSTGAYPAVPTAVRTYVWCGLAACTPWVLYELCRINGWVDGIWRFLYCFPKYGRRCWERRRRIRPERQTDGK